MEGLTDRCAYRCVEIVSGLDFLSKKDERFNKPPETLLIIDNFEDGGSTNFEALVFIFPLTSGTLRKPLMEEVSLFQWMESTDEVVQIELELVRNKSSIFCDLVQLFPKSKQRGIAQLSREFFADMDAWDVHLRNGKEQLQVFVATYAVGLKTKGQNEIKFHWEVHHTYSVPTSCEPLAADVWIR